MRYKSSKHLIFGAVLALAAVAAMIYSAALAAGPKPEDEIKFRQSGMMFLRWNMGLIKGQVVTDPGSYDKERVLAAAQVIAAIANSGLDRLYGPATRQGKGWHETRVKPEYFQESAKVAERYQAFIKESNALVEAAHTGDPAKIKPQFSKVFKSCKACHKSYRAKSGG